MKKIEIKKRALLVCMPLLASACGAGGSDSVDAAEAAAAETTAAAAAQAETEGEANEGLQSSGGDSSEAADTGADEAARLVGRTGPVREMPVFAPWADADLGPFLAEVMLFPPQIPVPDNAVLTYVTHNQTFSDDGSSRLAFSGNYQPIFDRDWFRTEFVTFVDTDYWEVSGIDEDLEANKTRLEFSSKDPDAAMTSLWFNYVDGDAQKQPELSWGSFSGLDVPDGQIVVNEVLWPWVNDMVVPESNWNKSVTVTLGWHDGEIHLDRRWDAPVGEFETMRAFYENGDNTGFTIGEVEYRDTTWPLYRMDTTSSEFGFDGHFTIGQIDAEDDVYVNFIGTLPGSE